MQMAIVKFLWGIVIPLALSTVSTVNSAFVIINRTGQDVNAECGDLRWTVSVGEGSVVTAAPDGALEVLGPLESFKSIKGGDQPSRMCRVEAGNCFLAWDPVKVSYHSFGEVNSNGDYEWEVDKTGVSLSLQSIAAWSRRGGLDAGIEYEMLWQATSEHLSGATQSMCAPPSTPLSRAFYSVLAYFRILSLMTCLGM